MSTRILRFGKNQLSWCCLCIKASEAFPAGTPHDYNDIYKFFKGLVLRAHSQYRGAGRLRHSPYNVWYWLVEKFIRHSLTEGTNTLPALSGLAKEFQSLTGDRYCVGIWYNDLLKGLYWRRLKETIVGDSEKINPGKRPSIPRGPSWSWASVDTDIICWHNYNDQEAFVDIISCDIVLSGQNPFGEVSRGVLRLRGYLVEANMFKPNAEQAESQYRLRLDDKEGYESARWEAVEQDFWIPKV